MRKRQAEEMASVMGSELKDSLFFQKRPSTVDQDQSTAAELEPPTHQPANQEPKRQSSRARTTSSKSDTVIPRHHDTTSSESDQLELIRQAVRQLGKEAATHRFTVEEKRALKDIEYSYGVRGVRTSENEITRIAVNHLIQDYRENGENSILAQVLERLNR
jgi:hypothetical protein